MGVYRYTDFSSQSTTFSFVLAKENIPSVEKCFVDGTSLESLGRVLDGQIESYKDLLNSEVYIRALMFHENICPISPCLQIQHVNEAGQKPFAYNYAKPFSLTAGIHKIYEEVPHNSHICPIDFLTTFKDSPVEEQIVKAQNTVHELNKHKLSEPGFVLDQRIGRYEYLCDEKEEYFDNIFPASDKLITKFLKEIPESKVPTYFSNQIYTRKILCDDFSHLKEYLRPLDKDWDEFKNLLTMNAIIPFPPFLAIILSRASNRGEIVDGLLALRREFQGARHRIWDILDDATLRSNQDPIMSHKMLQIIRDEAESIVPTLLKGSRWRDTFSFNFINAGYVFFNLKMGNISPSDIFELLSSAKNLFSFQGPNIVSESLRGIEWSTLEKHFSQDEIVKMQKQ